MIIKPPRPRLSFDPYIAPVHGKRGPCALCQNYSDLTENHVPPKTVGNADRIIARSYMTSVTANRDLFAGRTFANGLKFRTLCKDCNNGLGGKEDKAIGRFFESTRKLVETPLLIPKATSVTAKPNLIYRGLLAHLVSANDNGMSTYFDADARTAFFGKGLLRACPWNLFYWCYLGAPIFLQRAAYFGILNPVRLIPMYIIKCYPLGFLFTPEPWFAGLPNIKSFLQNSDEEEVDLPIKLYPVDRDPVWPSRPGGDGVIFMGGDAYGILAAKD